MRLAFAGVSKNPPTRVKENHSLSVSGFCSCCDFLSIQAAIILLRRSLAPSVGVRVRFYKRLGFASEVELPEDSSYFVLLRLSRAIRGSFFRCLKKLSTNSTKHTK